MRDWDALGGTGVGNRDKLGGIGNTIGESVEGLEYPGRDCGQYREYWGRLEGTGETLG